jgi:AcrR family transcriptional regulator
MQKGYAATKTRDIAAEAGLNLALLNYYFRSKEKLFDIIMMENMQQFMQAVAIMVNNEEISLEKKIEILVNHYIDMLIRQPDLPLFVLSEIRSHPHKLVMKIESEVHLSKSHFFKQIAQASKEGRIIPIHPIQLIMNIIGLTVFPFIGSPVFQKIGKLSQQEFNAMMEERKKMIPKWINAMLKVK